MLTYNVIQKLRKSQRNDENAQKKSNVHKFSFLFSLIILIKRKKKERAIRARIRSVCPTRLNLEETKDRRDKVDCSQGISTINTCAKYPKKNASIRSTGASINSSRSIISIDDESNARSCRLLTSLQRGSKRVVESAYG